MATNLENLQTRYDTITAELAAGQTSDGQKFTQPSVSVDGEVIDTDKYKQGLYDELDRLGALIEKLTGPWTMRTVGVCR